MHVCTRYHINRMKLTQEDIAELEAVFHIFTGGRSSGTIGRTELDLAMNYLGIDVDEAQLKRIFDKLDKDGACYSPLSPSCLFQRKLLDFVALRPTGFVFLQEAD